MTDTETHAAATHGSVDQSPAAPLEWAPAPPKRNRRGLKIALWTGIPAAALLVGAGVASTFLIAPGTTVSGVDVTLLTPAAAAERVEAHIAGATVDIDGQSVEASALGLSVDVAPLARAAHEERPAWNVTQWFGDPLTAEVHVDEADTTGALAERLPEVYVAPTEPQIAFDTEAGTYTAQPSVEGSTLDLAAVDVALTEQFAAGTASPRIDAQTTPLASVTSDGEATALVEELNAVLADAGFYIGDDKVVPLEPAVTAGWITVGPDADGRLAFTVDESGIQGMVDGLGDSVDRAPIEAQQVTDSAGTVLRTMVEGRDGYTLGDTTGVAAGFAQQLARGEGRFELPATVEEHATTSLERLLEVDLASQMLYMKENGRVVDSWLISSGLDASPTHTGRYNVVWHERKQTMRMSDPDDPYWNYEVPNVEWVMYFNGDQAFHGVYWHDAWGERRSHGCVGMPNWRAQQIYEWAPDGVDVLIR